MLKSIKRRNRFNKAQDGAVTCLDLTPEVEVELETLKNDQNTMRLEILKLRQQQEDSQSQMSVVEERIRCAECKQQQMLNFFGKIARYPNFVQQLIRKRKQQRELDGVEFGKRRRLLATQDRESLPQPVDTSGNVNSRNQAQEQLASMQSELTDMLPDGVDTDTMEKVPLQGLIYDDLCSPIEDLKGNLMCGASVHDTSSVYHEMVGNLLGDSSVVENVTDDEVAVNDTQIFHELEDLIGKPHNWAGYVNELVEQAVVGSIF